MSELVSIIVPVYNSEKWLSTCIRSLLQQTYSKIEIILVNDGSTDNSDNICLEYFQKNKNIRYIKQNNGGASRARNVGIQTATGTYLTFVDSDDWVSKDYIHDLVHLITKYDADFAISGLTYESTTPKIILPTIEGAISQEQKNYQDIIYENEKTTLFYSPCIGIYRTQLVNQHRIRYPEDVSYGEDRIFNWKYVSICKKIALIRKSNYHYRQANDCSLSQRRTREILSNAERLYKENLLFYEKIHLNTQESSQHLSTRLLNAISNELLCSTCVQLKHVYRHVKKIAMAPYIHDILLKADKHTCPFFIYYCLKYKAFLFLSILLSVNAKKKKLNKRQYIVLSHPLRNNYGGCIQSYALVYTLKMQGFNAILYDYGVRKLSLSLYEIKNFIKKVILYFKPCNANSPLCPDFMYTDLPRLPKKLIPLTTKLDISQPWIVGSDQVWRVKYARNIKNIEFFFLNFLPYHLRRQSISYASSFGTNLWEGNSDETSRCSQLLQSFKAVSVRELSGICICRQYFGVNAQQVPDPTMLLQKNIYNSIISQSKTWSPCHPYIGHYFLDDQDRKKICLVSELSEQQQCPALSLFFDSSAKIRKYRFPFSIPQWLRLIRDCEYFITDSFHGCVFAIIFNKPFVCLGNEGRGNARFDTLLGTFGLEDRLITDATPEKVIQALNTPIDWKRVNDIHDTERERGINFLKENLL